MRRAVYLILFLAFNPLFLRAKEATKAKEPTLQRTLATATESKAESQGSQLPLNWLCSAKAFTKKFDALGASRAEAKLNAKELCKAQYNEMHCNDFVCEGPDSGQPLGWTCKLVPFGKIYEAAAVGRAEAKFKSQKLCKAENSEIFCENASCIEG